MILFPEKEYSQAFLEALNHIAYGFLESATEYLIDETDEEFLFQELSEFFPLALVKEDAERCFDTLKTLYAWIQDDHYHSITALHEFVLMQSIRNEWGFFESLPRAESQELRDLHFQFPEEISLSAGEKQTIEAMKQEELLTLSVLFDENDFGMIELASAFYSDCPFTFLRF